MKRPTKFIQVFSVITMFLGSAKARAYRAYSDLPEFAGSSPVRWSSNDVTFVIDTAGSDDLSFGTIEDSLRGALSVWSSNDCSDLRLSYGGASSSPVRGDGINTIGFVELGWTDLGLDSAAMAFTDVVFHQDPYTGTWYIVEADILFNASNFTWSKLDVGAGSTSRDFRAVLTHELGHALGLMHPCELAPTGGEPACASDASFMDTTMYPDYLGAQQESIGTDDSAGICDLYPTAPCDPACASGTTCVHGACVPVCGSTFCSAWQVCEQSACTDPCAGVLCYGTTSCTSQSDCAATDLCFAGTCLMRGGATGDPCTIGSDCADGNCSNGHCARLCVDGCEAGYACPTTTETLALCTTTLGELGDACSVGDACASGMCLLRSSNTNHCTRSCNALDALPCPEDFTCELVGSDRVCVAQVTRRARGSCQVSSPDGSDSSRRTWWIGSMLFVGSLVRRSTQRRGR